MTALFRNIANWFNGLIEDERHRLKQQRRFRSSFWLFPDDFKLFPPKKKDQKQ